MFTASCMRSLCSDSTRDCDETTHGVRCSVIGSEMATSLTPCVV